MAHPLLRVGVIGGGPAGLATAINLAEWAVQHGMQDIFSIAVMDTRYLQDDSGPSPKIQYGGSRRAEAGVSNRRGQVVTLQQDCLDFLSQRTRDELFRNVNESVWSRTSYNIPIREVEDRLLERAQMNDVSGVLSLEVLNHTGSDEALSTSLLCRFNIIIGADGSKSWVRRHLFKIDEEGMQSGGRDLALGIEFQIPEHLHKSGLPHAQPLNVVLTVSQCRFLLNASSVTRSGFLNMQLTKEEWDLAKRVDGQSCVFARSPGILLRSGQVPDGIAASQIFKPQDDYVHGRGSVVSRNLWKSIIDGLKLFGIDQDHVASIVGVELNVRYSPKVVQDVGETICLLVGDAAFQTHFWPGRGMNSVFKEAASLANSLFLVGRRVQCGERLGSGLLPFTEYRSFLAGLRELEHDHRSLRFVCQRSGPRDSQDRMPDIVEQATYQNVNVCRSKLVETIEKWAETFSKPKRLHFSKEAKEALVSKAIAALENIGDYEVKIMEVSGPWPRLSLDEFLPNIGTPDPQECNLELALEKLTEVPFPAMSPAGIEELTDEQQDKQNVAKAAPQAVPVPPPSRPPSRRRPTPPSASAAASAAASVAAAAAVDAAPAPPEPVLAQEVEAKVKELKAAAVGKRNAEEEAFGDSEGESDGCGGRFDVDLDVLPVDGILPGCLVRMEGLQARPELNGLVGRAIKFNEEKERWQVRLEDRRDMLLKDENLVQLCPDECEEVESEAARLLEENRQKYVAGLKEREGEYKEKADAEKAEKDKVESERRERVRKRESEEKAEKEKEAKADEPGVPKSHGPPEDVD